MGLKRPYNTPLSKALRVAKWAMVIILFAAAVTRVIAMNAKDDSPLNKVFTVCKFTGSPSSTGSPTYNLVVADSQAHIRELFLKSQTKTISMLAEVQVGRTYLFEFPNHYSWNGDNADITSITLASEQRPQDCGLPPR